MLRNLGKGIPIKMTAMWKIQSCRQHLMLALGCLLGACRTDPANLSATVVELAEVPTELNCQKTDAGIPCVSFDQGKGSDTAEALEEKGLQFAWIGDLAQLYAYYESQVGREFEKDHVFKKLSFESEQILVVADEQSTKAGRKIAITRIEKDGDGYLVYVDKWMPKKKGSGCKSFSNAVSRPYHMVQIEKSLTFHEESRPEVKLVPTQKYYKCPPGQILE